MDTIRQCCVGNPVWIFVYSDESVYIICDKDFESPAYRLDVIKIINIESQESFTPEKLFEKKE